MPRHNVVLVPGFLGFSTFGKLAYFCGIRSALERAFERHGVTVQVTEVVTLPTASIRVRAAKVLETLACIVAESDGPIHIIGHSTGGLDARLAIAPTASLPTTVRFEAYDRVHTLVTVSCPHFGSPLATFFSGGIGRWLLRAVARYLIWLLKSGRITLAILLRLGQVMIRLRDPFRRRLNTFDEIYSHLLDKLTHETRADLVRFLDAVSTDESLVFQLTPAGCDLLNACTADPQIRYGSVVTRARPPSFRSYLRTFSDAYAQLLYPVYWFMFRLAARHEVRWIPEAVGEQRDRLKHFYGDLPAPHDNDGIVPTNSQIWGEVVHAAVADHLDVVGHFGAHEPYTPAGDWLPSQSSFDLEQFESLWSDVASFIVMDRATQTAAGKPTPVGTERTDRDLKGDQADKRVLRVPHKTTEANAGAAQATASTK